MFWVFDGNKTHTKSLKLIDFARDNGAVLISFSPHASYKFQSNVYLSHLKCISIMHAWSGGEITRAGE